MVSGHEEEITTYNKGPIQSFKKKKNASVSEL